MFRAPLYFAVAWIAGLLAQVTDGQGWGVHESVYAIFGLLLVPAFSAVWVKMWTLHATILNGKDERIEEVLVENRALKTENHELHELVRDLRDKVDNPGKAKP